jgi:hypothetical protein
VPPETVILFVAIAVGGLLFALVAVAVVVLLIRGMARSARSNPALQGTGEQYLAGMAPKLQPWRAGALADFSSLMEMVGYSALGSIHYRGTVKSLSQPEATGWLAYELRLKRAKGSLLLRTSAQMGQLDIDWSSAQVTVSGNLLGRWQARGREVTLLDAKGRPVGRYQRQPRKPWIVRRVPQTGYFDPGHGPVELRGRLVAEINSNLIPSKYIPYLKDPVPPLLQKLDPELEPVEEDWLLALVGLEVYDCIARDLSDRT